MLSSLLWKVDIVGQIKVTNQMSWPTPGCIFNKTFLAFGLLCSWHIPPGGLPTWSMSHLPRSFFTSEYRGTILFCFVLFCAFSEPQDSWTFCFTKAKFCFTKIVLLNFLDLSWAVYEFRKCLKGTNPGRHLLPRRSSNNRGQIKLPIQTIAK